MFTLENIIAFIIFSLAFIVIYHAAPSSFKKFILLVANVIYYLSISTYEGGGTFVIEIICSYCLSKILSRNRSKIFLSFSIILTVLALTVTKYQNFLPLKFFTHDALKILVPAGISFYTLKIIACYVEIYQGKIKPLSLIDYINYIALFTQILSGPVMRADAFTEDLTKLKFDIESAKSGAFLILAGLFKKLCVANMITGYVNSVHNNISGVPGLALWMSAFLYAIEIYADFSGWSDISNGLMQILGFRETKNFNTPYFAVNIKEFWGLWHISFSSWLRDYVYIPLGGGRCSQTRKLANVLVTFLISGIWHGSGINFIIWGIAHGLGVYFIRWKNKFLTFIIVMLLWIPFRAVNFDAAVNYFARLFTDLNFSLSTVTNTILPFTGDNTCAVHAVILFSEIVLLILYDLAVFKRKDYSFAFTFIFALLILLFGRAGESAFIYAQF